MTLHQHVHVSMYLLVNERFASFREPGRVQRMQFFQNRLHVSRPHVLRSIDPEPRHPDVDEVVQVLRHLGTHVVFLQRQVQKANQTTVSDLLR